MESSKQFRGDNKLLIGIIIGVLTFWLFAQSLVNVVPTLQSSFNTDMGTINIAISLTALFSGLFIVGAGDIADKLGRVKMTYIGLALNVIGSLCLIIAPVAWLLLVGRALQGLSGALIMPSTLAIINEYYIGKERQRAVSYWSIGSWGGSGICSLFGGFMASTIGWQWIFIVSIALSILAFFLIKHTPETKVEPSENETKAKFDVTGLILLVITLLSVNVMVTQAADRGLFSPMILSLGVVFIVAGILFIIRELKTENPLVDFRIFKNKGYSGATLSNFMLNGVAGGTLIVVNTYYQSQLGFSSLQAGLISITYLVAVLIMIRVGEKLLQKLGAKKPLLVGSGFSFLGLLLLSLTFLPDIAYIISSIIGYLLFGIGLGTYATPSTDTAVAEAPDDKVGVASGLYKMASSLGNAFGVAMSSTIFGFGASFMNLQLGGAAGVLFNAGIALTAFIVILILVPKKLSTN
ncbi:MULTISPECIES: MFS transporter [unclassified Staphylococcus]|uniref:MFS transporter n=1 Tax=unclassified Staphylococcus TaxID=91994 RepID=UPI00187DDC88|nr:MULTISPECIES: MFS transporter [unclassified Staphylococcus]MBF2757506.1 MFS transporter [Staphylococcus haemolyticus]MBF2774030.1 MFS transporter [Staphylococcus haemolyticus]MBF2775996.1 MFS transporter [Staphylococcus haemolyticus]MBF2815807.1 MFS transporter [Staphylococcus haemolyticus]MBF9719473.1 MFS transporter [Staphylococcus haemolyticus]